MDWRSGPNTTDFLTNAVRLSAFRVQTDLEGLYAGDLRGEWLGALLHESAHHWCFCSPLAFALTIQQLRTRTLLVTGSEDENLATRQVRCQIFSDILRPLAEGLALLSELHGVMDNTRLGDISRLQYWTLWMTHRQVADREKQELFSAAFVKQALSDHGMERRVNVMSQPFDCSLGGYLPGYLAIRAIWHDAALQYPSELGEFSSFVTAARFNIYYDPVLIKLSLKSQLEPDDLIKKVLARIAYILRPETLIASMHERLLLGEASEVFTYKELSKFPGFTPDTIDRPRELGYSVNLACAVHEIVLQLYGVERMETALEVEALGGNRALLSRRELLWVTSQSISVKRFGQYLTTETGRGHLVIGEIFNEEEREGSIEARLDIALSLIDQWLVATLTVGEEPLMVTTIVGDAINEKALFPRGLDEIERAEEAVEQRVRQHMPKDVTERTGEASRTACASADRWCAQLALRGNKVVPIETFIKQLRFGGYQDVFTNDIEALRAFAALATTSTFGPYSKPADELCLELNIPAHALANALNVADLLGVRYLLTAPAT